MNTQDTSKSVPKLADVKMTEYSHGAGCGCKISPAVLDVMLQSNIPAMIDESLLVGNNTGNKSSKAVVKPVRMQACH